MANDNHSLTDFSPVELDSTLDDVTALEPEAIEVQPDWEGITKSMSEGEAKAEPDEKAKAEAEKERLRVSSCRKMFYEGLCVSFSAGNHVAARRMYGRTLKTLDLKHYGPMGEAASDQTFNQLCKVEFFAKYLMKLDKIAEFFEQFSAIAALMTVMYLNVKGEVKELKAEAKKAEAAKKAKAANDNSDEAGKGATA